MTTITDLKKMVAAGELVEHHTAKYRGYVSRKLSGIVSAYDGRYGKGFVVLTPNWQSSQYAYKTYYVFPESKK